MLLLASAVAAAFALSPMAGMAPASRSVVLRMEEGGPRAKYAAKLPSTPENMAACKAQYEVNKAARMARKAPKVGTPGKVGATKKRKKKSKFDKGKKAWKQIREADRAGPDIAGAGRPQSSKFPSSE